MYIQRKADTELAKWKSENKHKPLLVRGARQVGKTNTIREFGKNFEFFIEINFEQSPRLKALFSDEVQETRKLPIFLSYGHDDNEELVRLIKTYIEKRGHDVWLDKNEIKFGDEWRR